MGDRVDEKDGSASDADTAEHIGRVVPPEHQHGPADSCDSERSQHGAQRAQQSGGDEEHCGRKRRDRSDRP
jgi:hypothetical protein